MKKIIFNIKNREIKIKAKQVSFFGKFFGLMFSPLKNSSALLFDFKKNCKISIHSLFVFYEFLAIWFNERNEIVDAKIIKPFKLNVLPKKEFVKLLEIPINNKYSKIVKILVEKFRKV